MTTPHELNYAEIQENFLDRLAEMVRYWHDLPEERFAEATVDPAYYRMSGLVFSILATLDGAAMALPGFIVAPSPHPDDKQFHIDNGENYFPDNSEAEPHIRGDIAGGLHEHWHPVARRHGIEP